MNEGEYNRVLGEIVRNSHRFYCYINIDNKIIGVHVSNPTFDHLRCAEGSFVNNGALYTVSKMFGTFYTNQYKTCIYQCCQNESTNALLIYDFWNQSDKNSRELKFKQGVSQS